MESKVHKDTANYYHQKLKEMGGNDILLPQDLRMSDIASTIDIGNRKNVLKKQI